MREAEIAGHLVHGRIVADRPGQVVEGEVETSAVVDQLMDFRIGLGARQVAIELREHDLGDRQSEGTPQFARHEFGDERTGTLSGATELEDVQAVVVCVHDGRERPAFAERCDVPRDLDRAEGGHGPILTSTIPDWRASDASRRQPAVRRTPLPPCGSAEPVIRS